MAGFEIKKVVREYVKLGIGSPLADMTLGKYLDAYLHDAVMDGVEVRSVELELSEEDWAVFVRQTRDQWEIERQQGRKAATRKMPTEEQMRQTAEQDRKFAKTAKLGPGLMKARSA